jgi:hypothetical protein
MGLSIHYSGRINNYSEINILVEEVQDICDSLHWDYNIWVPANDEISIGNSKKNKDYTIHDLNGISISVLDCETVFFTFLPDGRLSSPLNLLAQGAYTDKEMIYTVATKTQYAGPDTHMALVKLIRYLKEKYLDDLQVDDEGLYWETGDKKVLLSQFDKYNHALSVIEAALLDFKAIPGESAQSLAERLDQLLVKKLKGDKY